MEDIPESFAAFEEVSPTFGRAFAWGMSACDGFGPRSGSKPLDINGAGAAPIVVIGTTRDPATPMKWAEALSEQLDSAVLVRRDGNRHTGYNMGNECVDSIVEDYLMDDMVRRHRLLSGRNYGGRSRSVILLQLPAWTVLRRATRRLSSVGRAVAP